MRIRDPKAWRLFWHAIAESFNPLGTDFVASGRTDDYWMRLGYRDWGHWPRGCRAKDVHYEWYVAHGIIATGVHFEFPEMTRNASLVDLVERHRAQIQEGVEPRLVAGIRRGRGGRVSAKGWAGAWFPIRFEGSRPPLEVAPHAAGLMATFIERTWPLLQQALAQAPK